MKYIDKDFFIPTLDEGEKLYHYTSIEGLHGICKGEFWITEAHFLNDSSEFQIGTEIFLELMREFLTNESTYDLIEEKLLAEVNGFETKRIRMTNPGDYVISFCLEEDSPLLWSEYSDFMGYCMKFDYKKLLDSFHHNILFHGAVIYDHEEQIRSMKKSLSSIFEMDSRLAWNKLNNMNEEDVKRLVSWASIVCMCYNMFFKKSCFKGEKEYRFVFSCAHNEKEKDYTEQHFRIKGGLLVPYIKKPIDNLNSLESVLVGPKNTSDLAITGLDYFFNNLHLNIEIKKSQMPLRY